IYPRPVLPGPCSTIWCERGDSNSHGLPHWILSPARLPIPPLSPKRQPGLIINGPVKGPGRKKSLQEDPEGLDESAGYGFGPRGRGGRLPRAAAGARGPLLDGLAGHVREAALDAGRVHRRDDEVIRAGDEVFDDVAAHARA